MVININKGDNMIIATRNRNRFENPNGLYVVAFVTGHGIDIHKVGCGDIKTRRLFETFGEGYIFPDLATAIENYLDTGDEEDPGWVMDEIDPKACTNCSR